MHEKFVILDVMNAPAMKHIIIFCLIYTLIHRAHWSDIMHATIPRNHKPETDPELDLDPL